MAKEPPKVWTKLDSKGIEELLNSDEVVETLEEIANDITPYISGLHNEEEEWKIDKYRSSDRTVVTISNDDPELKWKEFARPKIARKLKRMNIKKRRKKS